MAGGIHHVTSRGNRRQPMFYDADDRQALLRDLTGIVRTHDWRVLTWCLMGNHIHLVLETAIANLGDGMRNLLSRHALRLNRRHGLDGRLIQGPFGSIRVESDRHLACLLRYVALNPVNGGLCGAPGEWPWSNHRALIEGREGPLAACGRVEELLDGWGGRPGTRYARLLAPHHEDFGTWTDARDPLPPRPPVTRLLAEHPLDRAIRVARWEHGYKLSEIAEATGLSEATISRRTRT